jgi:tetratricopeptide (TPR) repeat protein
VHALLYFVGKASDMVVSLYCRTFRLENECLADFNKTTGIDYARQGYWGKAIPLLEKALVITPGDLDVRMYLAEAYSGVNKYDNACEHLEKILEKNPKSTPAVRTLGMIYSRRQDYDRAIEYLQKAGGLDPDHAKTFYRLGAAYDHKKQYKQAVECFKKAIKLDPRFGKAYQALGFTYEGMKAWVTVSRPWDASRRRLNWNDTQSTRAGDRISRYEQCSILQVFRYAGGSID